MSLLLIITCTCLAVMLLTVSILYPYLTRRTVIQERLDELVQKEPEILSAVPKKTFWQDILAKCGRQLTIRPSEQSKYARMLTAAGFRKDSVSIFLGFKLVFAVILPLIFIFFYALPHGIVLRLDSLLYAVALAICGFLLPSFWLYRKVDARKTEIFHTLPDVLDLLTICVEAGLGMDAAIIRASENPIFAGNPLAEELKTTSREVRAGKLRAEALHDMAERTMVDDIKSFVTMLIQTEKFGTSLSQTLRVYAESLRTKRSQIAQEEAAKTSIKILFPLAFFIFPALMLVMVGPAFYKIIQALKF